MDQEIGRKVKQIRQSNSLTLQELASLTNLSVSYLSLVERGMTSLTIINLQKICSALNITMSNLLSDSEGEKFVVRENERNMLYESTDSGVVYEAMTEGERNLSCVCMIISDKDVHLSEAHVADEVGTVISGSMMVTLEDNEAFEIVEGDTIYIPAFTQHSFVKTSRKDCISYWTYDNTKKSRGGTNLHKPK